ncbi:hypothetical protein Pcinc_017567 [Petrolisthes cinctipes]|uniref:Uncharacterized protein n=1 Tax=Petrolisthes cinctipes TaxID=88211 RepID=A0AAE1FP13_PETCI|nr:hypothetical protein Pcinc_017567 [Petrolisthes cinctipes]
MGDYGSFVPNALRTSQYSTLATLGKRLFLDSDHRPSDPYGFLISKVFEGTHALLVVGDYLRYTQSKKKITRTTYLMDEKVRGDGVLNLSHLQGAFILLVLGLHVSFLILLLERLTKTPPYTSPTVVSQ